MAGDVSRRPRALDGPTTRAHNILYSRKQCQRLRQLKLYQRTLDLFGVRVKGWSKLGAMGVPAVLILLLHLRTTKPEP